MDQRPRKLIVCLDGTWNQRDSKEAPTNVAKIARAIAPLDEDGISQLIYYHPGVGSGNLFDRIIGGAFGAGLSANIESAYSFLADNYRDNDLIYLFGFSRGAFTARSLAGLVGLAGLLKKSDMGQFQTIYDIYRSQGDREQILSADEAIRSKALEAYIPKDQDAGYKLGKVIGASRRANIFFIGVWDTVGSLGVPFGPLRTVTMRKYAFHDTDLGKNVTYAYQALAIDERRSTFTPTLWARDKRRDGAPPQTLQQVWFAGCHSNIGGGYDDSGLSDMSLVWMAAKAAAATHEQKQRPLKFDEDYFDNKDNFDSGMGTLVSSRTFPWYLLPRLVRRPMQPPPPDKETCEKIHESVVMRHDASGSGLFTPKRYRPKNARQYLNPVDPAVIEKITPFEITARPNYAPDRS
jgi:uncharacterized protein (DUF2235 family)